MTRPVCVPPAVQATGVKVLQRGGGPAGRDSPFLQETLQFPGGTTAKGQDTVKRLLPGLDVWEWDGVMTLEKSPQLCAFRDLLIANCQTSEGKSKTLGRKQERRRELSTCTHVQVPMPGGHVPRASVLSSTLQLRAELGAVVRCEMVRKSSWRMQFEGFLIVEGKRGLKSFSSRGKRHREGVEYLHERGM